MTPEFIDGAVSHLVEVFGRERVHLAAEGGRTLLRVEGVEMPPGCKPGATTMLLTLDPQQPKPHAYVVPGQLLANGNAPRSTSIITVGGEAWMQYSFNIPWEEQHGIIRFIAAARQRFAQHD